jgi:polyisoprenoid-binding protein YceI
MRGTTRDELTRTVPAASFVELSLHPAPEDHMRYLLSVSSLATLTFAVSTGIAPAPHAGPTTNGGGPSSYGWTDSLVAVPSASTIKWKGTKFAGFGKQEGTVSLARGLVVVRHGQLVDGTFTVDMRRLQVTGVTGAEPRRKLRDHLVSADFFDVERYPTAAFAATGATRAGEASYRVTGDLTLHGVTRPVSFVADVRWPEVGHMIATSTFSIDRQEWGLAHRGSRLTNELADDEIQLSITLDARRRGAQVAER